MKKKIISSYVEKVFETSGEYAQWGGYYNYDFLSADGTKLLSNRSSFDGRAIEKGDTVEVGYFDIATGEWHCLDVSDSFNWPQATMLQWVPNTDNKEVIFNLSKDGRLISRIINIETKEKRDLCYPIYCLTPDGKKAITLNLERSYWTPAYHYQSVVNEDCNVKVLKGDGIFALDLKENTLETVVKLEDVLKIDAPEEYKEASHWLEHIMINRAGTEMVFLHRYMLPGGARETRMVMANTDGSNMHIVDGWQKYDWSHFGWKTDDAFVMYAIQATKFSNAYAKRDKGEAKKSSKQGIKRKIIVFCRKMLSPLIPKTLKSKLAHKNGYQLYEKVNGKYEMKAIYKGKLFDVDGHPSFTSDGKYMITDTYADEKKYRKLIAFNADNGKKVILGKFYSPFWRTPASCDLHPKLSSDGKHVVIDTAYSGIHKMMVLRIKWDKIKEVLS